MIRFFCAFSSVVRGISRKDRARSPLFLISELYCSMCCLCVNVYYGHQVSTQLQLNIYHIIRKSKSSVAVACFLPGWAKDLSTPPAKEVSFPSCDHSRPTTGGHIKRGITSFDTSRRKKQRQIARPRCLVDRALHRSCC